MTLLEITRNLENIAAGQINVRTVADGDIYEFLGGSPSTVYSVFFLTHTNSRSDESYDYFTFTLFYVDRLTDDYANRLQVQSIGRSIIDRVIRTFCEEYDIDIPDMTNINYIPFTEKFLDLTCGMYCTVTFQIPKDLICDDTDIPTIEITDNGTYTIGGYKVVIDVE